MSFNFDFTVNHLRELIGANPYAEYWHGAMCKICPEYEINTPLRLAAFIAQCAHESGNFKFLTENLNYRWESLRKVFPRYFPTDELAQQYARQPEKIANRVYASRMGNGPEDSGDGWRYRGRGLIQLTGHDNYFWFAASIETPIEEVLEYLETFEGAVQSACWFWETNKLNQWADSGDIETLSRRINGGTIGLEDRKKHYAHALEVLGGKITPPTLNLQTTLQRGSRGPEVQAMQRALGLVADGDFGPGTERALMGWQQRNGMTADGIAGPSTLQRLLG
jgi:putative chitinase